MLSSTQYRREPRRNGQQQTAADAWTRVAQGRPILAARLNCASMTSPVLASHGEPLAVPDQAAPFLLAPSVARNDHGLFVGLIGQASLAYENGDKVTALDAQALLNLYEARGADCLSSVYGSWAVVIVDPSAQCILAATDRLGRQPLYFHIDGDTLVIGSQLSALRDTLGHSTLDDQALYNYMYFHTVPAPGTAAAGGEKLRCAEMLQVTSGRHERRRYWLPTFQEKSDQRYEQACVTLKDTLLQSVKRSAAGPGKVGAFLSGGLDSSTVAGMLSELQHGQADAYAIGFDAEGYDEMAYARITARHFSLTLHEYYVTPEDVVQALPSIAATYDEPFGNSSALPAYFCARMAAEDGVDVLLAGDGGDELFAGNERYARQTVFAHYEHLPAWLRSRVIEPVIHALPAALPLVNKARSYIHQANTPLPGRLHYYSFLEQNAPEAVFHADFLAGIRQSQPLEMLEAVYHAPTQATALNRMLFLDWQFTLADNDLRKVTQTSALAGVEVRYPMLDEALVNLSTQLPSDWKMPGRALRDFYKKALTGWLPDETIHKKKQGFGLPFGVWMREHKPLQELAYDTILQLKERRLFLPAFLDQVVAMHRNDHASYFGELIWVLTSLEMWLATHEPGYRYG